MRLPLKTWVYSVKFHFYNYWKLVRLAVYNTFFSRYALRLPIICVQYAGSAVIFPYQYHLQYKTLINKTLFSDCLNQDRNIQLRLHYLRHYNFQSGPWTSVHKCKVFFGIFKWKICLWSCRYAYHTGNHYWNSKCRTGKFFNIKSTSWVSITQKGALTHLLFTFPFNFPFYQWN